MRLVVCASMLRTLLALRFPFFHQTPEVPRQELASDLSATDRNGGDGLSKGSARTSAAMVGVMPRMPSVTPNDSNAAIMADAAQLMTAVDANRDHNMGKDEITNFLQVPGREAYKPVWTEFDHFDHNRNEALNIDELVNLMVFVTNHPISPPDSQNVLDSILTMPAQSQPSVQTQSAVAPPLLPPFSSQGRPGPPARTEPVSKQSVAQLALSDAEAQARIADEPVVTGHPVEQAQPGAQEKDSSNKFNHWWSGFR
uniref:EF-hand domain-containing protein n=1 Tax=Noctiluca scintillans TaxID=2966 RepID=A0A7S1AU31_NOCSC|mmetsp:Transcript_59744/g.159023  ORF Transcript_59744/g.159023 Transcript_59744/m.159023 type:complete len:255 (+) Transcript_59744:82-846(+)